MAWVEIIGYVASVLVAGSLMMVSVVKLRLINLGGAVTFVVYGLLITSYPLVLTNSFIAVVNIYHLSRFFRADLNGFSYVPIDATKRHQLEEFLDHYREDLLRFSPPFALEFLDTAFAGHGHVYLALRNLRTEGFAYYVWVTAVEKWPDEEVAELFSHVEQELYPEQTVYVPADYVTSTYRDLGLVHKLHDQLIHDITPRAKFLVSVAEKSCRKTNRFLSQSGYSRATESIHYNLYVKTLS
ncbi:MAG: hypothetical protein ACQETQ_07795 [Spirochaetota bacterium]